MNDRQTNEILPKEVTELAQKHHIQLDTSQLHIGGERALMRPNKFVLTGIDERSGKKVVLKCARHPEGVAEIKQEHIIATALARFAFADEELLMPQTMWYGTDGEYLVLINTFLEQETVFTDYSIREQFFMALRAFESQEAFHATTREHHLSTRDLFPRYTPATYIESYKELMATIQKERSAYSETLAEGLSFLEEHKDILGVYDGYLIHSDFVPHNFRIRDRQLYLLDFVAFFLGNKYESWARFINFMEIHSPALVKPLLEHVRTERGEEEYLDLRLMRIYKICFLLAFYARILPDTVDNLRALTEARLVFWNKAFVAILKDEPVPEDALQTYYKQRDVLRTQEEKERQREFTWA